MTTKSPRPSPRRSQRLLAKQVPSRASRARRQAQKPIVLEFEEDDKIVGNVSSREALFQEPKMLQASQNFIELTDSEDDDDVVYLAPEPPPLIDLTDPDISESPRTPHKIKSKTCLDDHIVSPPKQRKVDENYVTPTKERQVDENLGATPLTPIVLLENLSLMSPQQERLRTRKKLFEENNSYQNARRALHSSCPTTMPGRERELKELKEFITKHLDEETSGTLYVSGPPGTGKTASLNLILEDPKILDRVKYVYVNCTSIKSSGSIYSRIVRDLGVTASGKSEKDYVSAIEKFLQRRHKTILLVLDEIDQLESKKQSVLYSIFEWPAKPDSRLILIGIANALDLTDRILPRLQARCELKPELMHFAPYTKQQIIEILTNRLQNAGVLEIFTPVALQMLAGKVAAISGDLRRALDIGRRVIEMADKKKRGECVLKSLENVSTELNDGKKTESVDLTQVIKVLNNVYGTTQNLDDEDEDSFPLQQKIVICSLLLILKRAKNKDVTVGRLHDVYRRVCGKRNIQVVDHGEFVGLCSLIETRGMIKVIRKKDPRMNKVSLVWDEEEVDAALKDKQLMSMILQDHSCLGNL